MSLMIGFAQNETKGDEKHGYFAVSLCFLSFNVVSLILAILIKIQDTKNGNFLRNTAELNTKQLDTE